MDLRRLLDTPPWEWPEDASAAIARVLRDDRAAEDDRLLAAELAGEYVVASDDLAHALVELVGNTSAPDALRARAAIALGPMLEGTDTAFDDQGAPIAEATFGAIQRALRKAFDDPTAPVLVRRRALEASVRAPARWHRDAIATISRTGERDWTVTAVFCMGHLRGFDAEIVEALGSGDDEVQLEAVRAAGEASVEAAWPRVAALVDAATSKPLLLAAIEAVAAIRPSAAAQLLRPLLDTDDEEIVDAVEEALAVADEPWDDDIDDDESD